MVLTITAPKLNFMWFHWNHSIVFWNQAWFQKQFRCFCWFQHGFIETILVSKRYFGPKMAKNEVSLFVQLDRTNCSFFIISTMFCKNFPKLYICSDLIKMFLETETKCTLVPADLFSFHFIGSYPYFGGSYQLSVITIKSTKNPEDFLNFSVVW